MTISRDLRSFGAKFLADTAGAIAGRTFVVGRSGNFTLEFLLAQYAEPIAIHSNDCDFWPCMLGRWLSGRAVEFEIIDSEFDWLAEYMDTDARRISALAVMLNMIQFRKRDDPHAVRMWNNYRAGFGDLVGRMIAGMADLSAQPLASFTDGDVLSHFQKYASFTDVVFACYAPSYSGDRKNIRLIDDIVNWSDPEVDKFDGDKADDVWQFLQGRNFLWFDGQMRPGVDPVVMEKSGKGKQWDSASASTGRYLYCNLIGRNALSTGVKRYESVSLPVAGDSLVLDRKTKIGLSYLNPSELLHYKAAYMHKVNVYKTGKWAFAVWANNAVIGFIEFDMPLGNKPGELYLNSDFCVVTPYAKLSKLIVMLAISHETRRMMELALESRVSTLRTTAFTDKFVSMKYRGVLALAKRGKTGDGRQFLNYRGQFNQKSWRTTLMNWLDRYGHERVEAQTTLGA